MTAPVSILRGVPIREIAALFASFPRLTPEEAAAFSRDLDEARAEVNVTPRDPWETCAESPTNRRS
jgi:hypothetical protein